MENLKRKLESREKILSTTLCNLFYTGLPSLYKKAGIDFLVFDLEHGSYNIENVEDMLYACRKEGITSIVRVTDSEYAYISKPIDMGADGILLPRTETIEQVELAISSMRFYPIGKKGAGGRGLLKANESVEDFNKNRLLFLQIESPAGVRNLDAMLTKYPHEVAGILIGPSDMAITSGCGLNSEADAAVSNIRETVRICNEHRISVGIWMGISSIERWHGEGMNLFWVSTEIGLLSEGINKMCEKFNEI